MLIGGKKLTGLSEKGGDGEVAAEQINLGRKARVIAGRLNYLQCVY